MSRVVVIAAGVVGLGAALYLSGAFDQVSQAVTDVTTPVDEQPQGVSLLDQAANWFDPSTWDLMSFTTTDDPMQDPNVVAFLKVIRYAEGTSGPDGYNKIFWTPGGPNTFTDMTDHPHVAKQFRNGAGQLLWTTAAGAYQFMAASRKPDGTYTHVDTWTGLKNKLGLPDFSPASQDQAAVELIREAGALPDVRAGRFDSAISRCKGIWASLPGANYAQPTKSLPDLRNVFAQAGGTIAQA